jgi:hypothetical protein
VPTLRKTGGFMCMHVHADAEVDQHRYITRVLLASYSALLHDRLRVRLGWRAIITGRLAGKDRLADS